MFYEEIRTKHNLSYISICSLSFLYSSKFILILTSLWTNAVVQTRVLCIFAQSSSCAHLYITLTHLCRVDSSILTLWTGSFQYKECLVSLYCYGFFFIEIPVFNANSIDPVLRRLIWVYTVCQCAFYRSLGINGLIWVNTVLWSNVSS